MASQQAATTVAFVLVPKVARYGANIEYTGVMNMDEKKNKEQEQNKKEFVPKEPDYSGVMKVAAWDNDGVITVKLSNTLKLFKNDDKEENGEK